MNCVIWFMFGGNEMKTGNLILATFSWSYSIKYCVMTAGIFMCMYVSCLVIIVSHFVHVIPNPTMNKVYNFPEFLEQREKQQKWWMLLVVSNKMLFSLFCLTAGLFCDPRWKWRHVFPCWNSKSIMENGLFLGCFAVKIINYMLSSFFIQFSGKSSNYTINGDLPDMHWDFDWRVHYHCFMQRLFGSC